MTEKPFIYLTKNLQLAINYDYGIVTGLEEHHFIGVSTGETPRQAKKNATRYGEKTLRLDVMSYSDFIHLIKQPEKEQEKILNRITHNKADTKAYIKRLEQDTAWINEQVRALYKPC